MAALAKLDTAARVRDVVKKVASRVVDIEVSTPLVGRVTAIDLVHLKAMVWFAGDPNPIQVALFSSVIPGQSEAGFPTDQPSNGLVGYGSIVACQTLNGTLYVTQVLTGGQFSFDFDTLNQGMISQIYYDELQGGVQPLNGLKASGEMILQLPSIANGVACEFGPFTNTYDGGEQGGPMWLDVDVFEQLEGGAKTYRLNSYLYDDASSAVASTPPYDDRWMRIMPYLETGGTGASERNSDWHLDVSFKTTPYGLTPLGLQKTEVWFRIVVDSLDNSFVQPFVRIRSPWLHKARSVDGSEKLVATTVALPTLPKGYIGFHNSNGSGVKDMDTFHVRDQFNRTLSADLGTMSDYPSGYTLAGGGGSDYNVSGTYALVAHIIANNMHQAEVTNTSSFGRDFDMLARISVHQVSTGASVWHGFRLRKTGSTTYYWYRLEFTTGSQVNLSVSKNVSGTVTSLGTQASAHSYAADTIFLVRCQVKGSKLRMKFWAEDEQPPKKWNIVVQLDTAITASGGFVWDSISDSGNTNSFPQTRLHDLDVVNSSFTPVTNPGKWRTGPWRNAALRMGQDLQRTMQIEGAFTWDGSNISWTGEIFLGGVGASKQGLVDARHYITCPKLTTYTIPVYGGYSVTSVAVTTSGIPLALGQSLYCAVPPGEWEMDLAPFLFIVDEAHQINFDDSNRLWQYHLPEWSILIARRNPDYPDGSNLLGTMPIKLGTGDWLDNWHNIGAGGEPAFGTNWTNQAGWRSVGFRKLDPDHVELKGVADFTSTIAAPTGAIFTLPAGYRPSGSLYFGITVIGTTAATAPVLRGMQISTNGQLQITNYVGTIDPSPIPLEGIRFSVSG